MNRDNVDLCIELIVKHNVFDTVVTGYFIGL